MVELMAVNYKDVGSIPALSEGKKFLKRVRRGNLIGRIADFNSVGVSSNLTLFVLKKNKRKGKSSFN